MVRLVIRAHFDVIVVVYRSTERFFVVRQDEFLNKQPIDWDALALLRLHHDGTEPTNNNGTKEFPKPRSL